MRNGVMARNPATVAVDVGIAAFLSSSVFKCVLKSSSGRPRSAAAICASAARSAFPPVANDAPLSIESMAWSSCSIRGRSGIGALHLSPQVLDCAKLKLFHGALAAAKFFGNFFDALLFHKSLPNDL